MSTWPSPFTSMALFTTSVDLFAPLPLSIFEILLTIFWNAFAAVFPISPAIFEIEFPIFSKPFPFSPHDILKPSIYHTICIFAKINWPASCDYGGQFEPSCK